MIVSALIYGVLFGIGSGFIVFLLCLPIRTFIKMFSYGV